MIFHSFNFNIGNLSFGFDIECNKNNGDYHRKMKAMNKFCEKHYPCDKCIKCNECFPEGDWTD